MVLELASMRANDAATVAEHRKHHNNRYRRNGPDQLGLFVADGALEFCVDELAKS